MGSVWGRQAAVGSVSGGSTYAWGHVGHGLLLCQVLGVPGAAGLTAWPTRAGPGLRSQDEGALGTRLARVILLPPELSVRPVPANVPDSEAWPPVSLWEEGDGSQGRQTWLPGPQPWLVCRAPVSSVNPEEESSGGGAGGARQVSRSLRPSIGFPAHGSCRPPPGQVWR